MLKQLKKSYRKERLQFILTDVNGVVLDSDQTIFNLKTGAQLSDFHPFFFNLGGSLTNSDEHTVFQCVQLNSNKISITADIEMFKKNEGVLIVLRDLTSHYVAYQSIAQVKNENHISSELIVIKNQELNERERFKNEFIQNFSHEIRNPLTNILALTNILGRTQLDVHQKKTLNVLKESTSNLRLMLEDILSISMIAKGKLAIIPTVFSFTEFLNFLELTYSTRAKQKGLAFNLKADKKIPEYLEGDRLRLLQVLTNLCDNAIKYTEKGGISLEVELNQKWANTVNLRFAVKDTGQGISKENVELIFESFEQLGGNKGAGLGLPIVRGILNLMGSEVRLDSKINSGSTFYFDIKLNFPLKPVENFTPKPKTKRKKIVSKKKILLVEDDELIQMTLFKILVDSGDFFIDCLSDGAMVMEEVINNGYDLILMDVNLPNVQGDQLATVIRSLPFKNIKKTPIIGVTANSYSQDQKAYLKAGMNTVITKPFEESELLKLIYKYI